MSNRQPDVSDPLAGLISADASSLYVRLLRSGGLQIGRGANELDLDSAAGRELHQAGLLFGAPQDAGLVKAVAMTTAIQLLLSRAQAEITVSHRTLLAGWNALDAILRSAKDEPASAASENDGIEIVRDKAKISALSAELYISARNELCATVTGHFHSPLQKHQLLTPPKTSLATGARYRSIYDSMFAGHPAGASIIEASRQSGEEVRIRSTLPTKVLLIDDHTALVALTEPAIHASAIVRSPPFLAVLRDWFEMLWEDPGTSGQGAEPDDQLTAPQRRILRLLASSMSDDAIARATNMSVRTVRRHVTTILEQLGVSTRFAAGAAAARQGWL